MHLKEMLLPSIRSSRVLVANSCSWPLPNWSGIRRPLRLSRLPGTIIGAPKALKCYLLYFLDINSIPVVRENLCDDFGRLIPSSPKVCERFYTLGFGK